MAWWRGVLRNAWWRNRDQKWPEWRRGSEWCVSRVFLMLWGHNLGESPMNFRELDGEICGRIHGWKMMKSKPKSSWFWWFDMLHSCSETLESLDYYRLIMLNVLKHFKIMWRVSEKYTGIIHVVKLWLNPPSKWTQSPIFPGTTPPFFPDGGSHLCRPVTQPNEGRKHWQAFLAANGSWATFPGPFRLEKYG